MGLLMACYSGLYGILSGLTKSTDHPSRGQHEARGPSSPFKGDSRTGVLFTLTAHTSAIQAVA